MKKKILIVDDENDLVETLSFRLKAAGYDVASAGDGEEGLKKAKGERPDLILLDVMMPRMDGFEMCKVLKGGDETRHIPVIMLTAKGQDRDREIGGRAGADAYITKPFESTELLGEIETLLSE